VVNNHVDYSNINVLLMKCFVMIFCWMLYFSHYSFFTAG